MSGVHSSFCPYLPTVCPAAILSYLFVPDGCFLLVFWPLHYVSFLLLPRFTDLISHCPSFPSIIHHYLYCCPLQSCHYARSYSHSFIFPPFTCSVTNCPSHCGFQCTSTQLLALWLSSKFSSLLHWTEGGLVSQSSWLFRPWWCNCPGSDWSSIHLLAILDSLQNCLPRCEHASDQSWSPVSLAGTSHLAHFW